MNKTYAGAATTFALALTGCAAPMPDWRGTFNCDAAAYAAPAPRDSRGNGSGGNAISPACTNTNANSDSSHSSTGGRGAIPKAQFVDAGTSMDTAILYLNTARSAYRAEVKKQVDTEGAVSQGLLVGAGALLAAAGLKAHPDTFVAGGATLSTTYAMGTAGLPRTRMLAYMAGVEALNCAEAAVAPIHGFRPTDLKKQNETLRTAAQALQDAHDDALKTKKGPTEEKLQAALGAAEKTLGAANDMVSSTDDFLAKTQAAAYVLANHVEKIDAAVTRSVVNGMPNLADVKILSGAIGADITGIVGKAAIDANNSKQAAGGTKTPQAELDSLADNQRDNQRTEISHVETARNVVIEAMQKVRELLPVNANNLNMAAVSDCNLPSVPAPLIANLSAATFFSKTPQTTTVELKGGTKEYVADASGLPPGLSVKQPGPSGTSLDIVATDLLTKTGTYPVRIHDQTPGGNGIVIQIVVTDAAPKADDRAAAFVKTKAGPYRHR